MELVSKRYIRGFLKPRQVKRNLIEYIGPVGISLYERLKRPVSKDEFFFIMLQIADVTREIQRNNLFLNNLILNQRYVFINETTREIRFIYMPIVSNHFWPDIIGFMESIIYSIISVSDQNFDHISRYIHFIKGLNTFNADVIENYITCENRSIVSQIKNEILAKTAFIRMRRLPAC